MKKETKASHSDKSNIDHLIGQGLFWILILFSVFLLFYMHDGFYDLSRSKAFLFTRFMDFYLPFCGLMIIYQIYRRRFAFRSLFDCCVLLLLLVYLLSAWLSYDPADAFSGKQGWYVGAFAVASFTISYFALKDHCEHRDTVFLIYLIVLLIECFLLISDCARLDLLKLKGDFYESDYYGYFGTLGNSNWLVGYLSLNVPLFVCLYVTQKEEGKQWLFYLGSLLGLLSSVMNGADAVYLAYGVCFIVMIPYLFEKAEYLKRISILFVSVCIGLLGIRMIPAFARRVQRLSGFGPLLFDLRILLGLVFISLIVCYLCQTISEDHYLKIRKRTILSAEIVMILLALCSVYYGRNGLDNGRMLIWSHSIKTFIRRYSLKMKIFGIGPELLNNVYAPLTEQLGSVCICSHSEGLQILMTTGILGLIVWSLTWISLFMKCYKARKDKTAAAIFAAFTAYFVQGFVNSATVANLLILTVMAILANGTAQIEKSSNDIIKKKMKQRQGG